MSTERITVESLHATYVGRFASVMGLNAEDYEATPDGLASLLLDTVDRLSPTDPYRKGMIRMADDLRAADQIRAGDHETQKLLKRVDGGLGDAIEEIVTYSPWPGDR